MFDMGAPELLVLGMLAIIVFGPDKLPGIARKAAKAISYVRQMAGTAQNQLKSELGPEFDDLDFRDLNPKAFVQKHLFSDVDPLVTDLKDQFSDISSLGMSTVNEATTAIDDAKRHATAQSITTGNGVVATIMPALAAPRITTPYDPDAT